MAKSDERRVFGSLPLVLAAVFITGAVFLSRLPLETSRPAPPPGSCDRAIEREKADARLWQDPLEAALNHERTMHLEGAAFEPNDYRGCPSDHNACGLREQLADPCHADDETHVLMVMIRDQPVAEDHERRLRNRYALVTAMRFSGLTPQDSKHIQYFKAMWCTEGKLEENESTSRAEKLPPLDEKCVRDGKKDLLLVPFEWFERDRLYPETAGDAPPERVLILWLAETAFSHRPLARLAQLIDALDLESAVTNGADITTPRSCKSRRTNSIKVSLVGPSYSDTLGAMIDEIQELCPTKTNEKNPNAQPIAQTAKDRASGNATEWIRIKPILEGLTIYSPWSTASPALLIPEWKACSSRKDRKEDREDDKEHTQLALYRAIPAEFEKLKIEFIRTIGSDDLLAAEIIRELRRRGIDIIPKRRGGKGHPIVLLSELDTFYGKAFPLTLATMAECINPKTSKIDNWADYARRLNQGRRSNDALVPENLRMYSYLRGIDGVLPGAARPRGQDPNRAESRWKYARSPELPLGRSQIDYIRRLAQQYKRGAQRPKAVGVVGTDVYDKLLLFHALREELGNVVLFTIDLDARMMHRKQFNWTRNVIVASQYGLELGEDYRRDTSLEKARLSPFRDNYQTALHFTCRVALGMPFQPSWPSEPVSVPDVDIERRINLICQPRLFEIGRECAVDLSIQNTPLHPKRARFGDRWPWPALGYVAAMGTLLFLCYRLSANFRKIVHTASFCTTRAKLIKWVLKWKEIDNFLKLLILLTVLTLIACIVLVVFDHYRPAGEPFSLTTGVSMWPGQAIRLFATILCLYFIIRLRDSFQNDDTSISEEFGFPDKSKRTIQRGPNVRTSPQANANAQQLWSTCVQRGTLSQRIRRSIVNWISFWVLLTFLLVLLKIPITPYRGRLSWYVHATLGFFGINALILLLFITVDAIQQCLKVINPMIERPTVWSTAKFKDVRVDRQHRKAGDLADWLDVRFVAQLTERVGKLLYLPAVIMLLMIASRVPYFDNWGFPTLLVLIYGVPGAYIISCAIGLQLAARRARVAALRRLRERLDDARYGSKEDEVRARQIERRIEEVKSLRQGAFRPIAENPILHAVLIPSGGVSLLALLPYILRT